MGGGLPARGREITERYEIWFTIIHNRHETSKGYIIMEIMSTNVTKTTIYRGEFDRNTIYFGVN